MQTKTYTLLVTIEDEPHHPVFSPLVLADAVKGALEVGIKQVVIDNVPDANIPAVCVASVSAVEGDAMRFPNNHADPVKAIKRLHSELRAA